MDGYDEDLLLNPFYKSLTSKGKQLYQNATDNRWTVCIPRKGTTSRSHYNKQQFETHLLQPSSETNNLYTTTSNKEVKINGTFIVTTKGFADVKSIQILFEETFFNRNEESYHVLCIDQPLEGGTFSTHAQPVIQSLETLKNCIDFLWSSGGSKKSRTQIDEIISLFNSTYTRLASESVRHTMDASNAVFTRAMQACLKESHIRRPAMSNKAFMDNVKVAVETYVMDGIYKRVFKGISSFLTEEDAAFNKTTRNLADLQVKDLGINIQLCKNIPKAKKILSNINKFTTPLEKLYVLKLTITAMSESSKIRQDADLVTADDLLPALVFLVVKSEIPNWLTNLSYMQNFHFSRSKSDEFQFYLSSTEAAIEHVRTGRLDSMISMTHTQRLKMVNNLFKKLDDKDKISGPSPVDIFFENIRANRVDDVIKMLKESITAMKEITELLCHPLCSCDTCEKLLANKRKDPLAVTVFSRDDIGCTALHQAAEFGSDEIIYELIKKGGVVNATNYHGSTPLHLACQRGHHKATVILTHYGGDINAIDNGNNIPLHLAVANGHELCTDYLCSSECETDGGKKLDIDAMNENGDTALHIASRWGFGTLVYMLLKKGASIEIENKNKMTPRQCALNVKIQEILLHGTSDESKVEGYVYLPPVEHIPRSTSLSPPKAGIIPPDSPNTSRRKGEFTKLLKAVADGDVELVRHKLGVSPENETIPEDPDVGMNIEGLLCHPLCQCEKCSELQKKVVSETVALSSNMSNKDGVRALHVASLHGYETIVGLLLKRAGADPNVKTNTNLRTPLHLSCQYNSIESVSLLLKNGARANLKDAHGNTPLHFCCTNGHIGPAILLLQSGANVHSVNHRGNTPLHDAARWNFVDIARLLIHYDAPIDVKNKMQLSPLQYAMGEDVRSLLKEAYRKANKNIEVEDDTKKKSSTLSFSEDTQDDLFINSTEQNEHVFKTDPQICSNRDNCDEVDSIHIKEEFSECIHDRNVSCSNCGQMNFNSDNRRRTTITDLFEAFEEDNLDRLRQIANGIKNFDRRKSLRRVSTIDKSFSYLDHHYKTLVSIQKFDHAKLSHIEPNIKESLTLESINNADIETHSNENTDVLPKFDQLSSNSTLSELESPLVGSAISSACEFDASSCDFDTTDLLHNTIHTSALHDSDNLLTPPDSPQIEPGFEEWFDHDIATDSADEEIEGAPNFMITTTTNQMDETLNQSEITDADLRIELLLNEAIGDVDGNRTVTSQTGVNHVLEEDDDLFVPRL